MMKLEMPISSKVIPVPLVNSATRKRQRQTENDDDVQNQMIRPAPLGERNVKRQLWNSRGGDALQSVKEALHISAVPEQVLCRTAQQERIAEFCKRCIEEGTSGSLYVCGCPGTGKSITMRGLKKQAKEWLKESGGVLDVVEINCMTLSDPHQIFQKILDSLAEQGQQAHTTTKNKAIALQELKNLMKSSANDKEQKHLVLIIVDEMDHLMTRDCSVLYQMFLLPTIPDSRCILIGIANAIDLTDRFLPTLKTLNCNPETVAFPAYNKEQVLAILQQRLQGLEHNVFEPRALELCARKVAASSGDMRIALDVCRTALGVAESEKAVSPLKEDNCSRDITPCGNTVFEQHPGSARPLLIRVDHMAQALSGSFKSPVIETIRALPQHQQMVLCSAVHLFRQGKKDGNLGKLSEAYFSLCKKAAMRSLTAAEFSGMCTVLADQALIGIGGGRQERLRRVTLKVPEEDVVFALQGVRFFKNILQEGDKLALDCSK